VRKTTVYLPDDLKAALARTATRRGVSEAQLIRESLAASVVAHAPAPQGGLYHGTEPIARRVDELLDGFGQR